MTDRPTADAKSQRKADSSRADSSGTGEPTTDSDLVADEPVGAGTFDFVVAANRLPVARDSSGEWQLSPGGLVTAMSPVMEGRDGAWIGWNGDVDADPESTKPFDHSGISLHPVPLSKQERLGYYEGFSNSTLWPLYHNGILPTTFKRVWWASYLKVNRRFAQWAVELAAPNAEIWIHDYHLQLMPAMVRELRPDVSIGFFVHTPFPPSQLLMRLPWRDQIARGLLGSDLLGFQTTTDARNFLTLAHRLAGLDEVVLHDDVVIFEYEGRDVNVGAHPISIDYESVETMAADPKMKQASSVFRAKLGNPTKIVLGVDRLDYTKGIDARLKAFGELLEEGELDAKEVVFVQVATPSRDAVPGYADARASIEQLVGQINGNSAPVGRAVVHYLHRTLPFEELVPLYLAADVMLVTPFEDGMNLVAKEYVASRLDNTGVLVLSEFAGTAEEFGDSAVICNPFDTAGLKRAIMTALDMSHADGTERMKTMRAHLAGHTVHDWAARFLDQLG